MCGIAGFLLRNGEAQVSDVRAMSDVIRHRGPDDEGIYTDGPCGIGMRRLSIIDLSTGHQPISNEDGSVWVVFNGEIYNYQELRQDLIAARATSSAPTATPKPWSICTKKRAPTACNCCAGMFAFCIWDARQAQDPAGPRPLRQEAAVLRQHACGILLRQRTEVSARGRRAARPRSGRAAAVFPVWLHCRSVQPVSQPIRKLMPGCWIECSADGAGEAGPLLAAASVLGRKPHRTVPSDRRAKSCASCSTKRCASA